MIYQPFCFIPEYIPSCNEDTANQPSTSLHDETETSKSKQPNMNNTDSYHIYINKLLTSASSGPPTLAVPFTFWESSEIARRKCSMHWSGRTGAPKESDSHNKWSNKTVLTLLKGTSKERHDHNSNSQSEQSHSIVYGQLNFISKCSIIWRNTNIM